MSTDAGKEKLPRVDERIHIDTRLDPKKDSDLLEKIWELKAKPLRGEKARWSYVQTYRDAFELILSLRKRDTSVLYRLFPWLLEEMPNQAQLNRVLNPLVSRLMEDPFTNTETDYQYKES